MNTNEESDLKPLHAEEVDVSARPRVSTPGQEESVVDTRAALEPRLRWRQRTAQAPGPELGSGNRGSLFPRTRLADQNVEETAPPAVVNVPRVRLYPERYEALQRFEGTVMSVERETFWARLVDRTSSGPEEEAEFPLAEVMPGDREMVKPGAMFYWVIGYEQKAYGQQTRSSVIRFRRLPAWTSSETEEANAAARTFLSFLDLNGANHPA